MGPHRDDIALSIGLPAATRYASHGESGRSRSPLKLGSFSLLRADGVPPVLVLRRRLAELDSTRRRQLASAVSAAEQLLVTAAVGADVPNSCVVAATPVSAGRVSPDD